jgi:hypothetical protein
MNEIIFCRLIYFQDVPTGPTAQSKGLSDEGTQGLVADDVRGIWTSLALLK